MPGKLHFSEKGLSPEEVLRSREKYGPNKLEYQKEYFGVKIAKSLAKEPMVLLLLATSLIYFISGETGDGLFLAAAILLVAAISLFQDSRSRNALEKLKDYTQPKCKVIRDGEITEIRSEDLVPGDLLVVDEGGVIVADGRILHSNDFSTDESILTGESLAVYKDKTSAEPYIYSGTHVASGLAIAEVTETGRRTRLGKIGESLKAIAEEKTPLEIQISSFVRKMVIAGTGFFLLIWAINYANTFSFTDSLLKALTLAMSILPEEIPVAFTTFMAIGAWRLMKMGIVVKQMKTVETLGSSTVICIDKTGTITENRMSLARIFRLSRHEISDPNGALHEEEKELIAQAMWASEPIPFDPMEKALHQTYARVAAEDQRPDYRMVYEYPLSGKPPMMTHVFENRNGHRILCAKGAPEALMAVSDLPAMEKQEVEEALRTLSKQGYRVLGVATGMFAGQEFPKTQQELRFHFTGLVAFHDPPKQNIREVLQDFYRAGIQVKIITGDNAETTLSIARQIDFRSTGPSLSGEELMRMDDGELEQAVQKTNVFTRMFPEAKLRIINALKNRREIVAMTGDGVNDGPALKAAHIGIAMGKKGTEIAKQAASLILIDDDLARMVDAIAMGRKIYANLKKAIQYIISIHIPIILAVFIPLALGWIYPAIFSPIHVIFLELIMGPTCSIIYENEPMEADTMQRGPKPFSRNFFSWKELSVSIFQGLAITAGILFTYQYAVTQGYSESLTRTMAFTTLIIANVFLTLINRSFYYSLLTTARYRNRLIGGIISLTLLLVSLMVYIPPLSRFFGFEALNLSQVSICSLTGLLSVIWIEGWKARRRFKDRKK